MLTVWPEWIPAALQSVPHWVVWLLGPPRNDGKRPKKPMNPRTRLPASPTDAATWASYGEAMAAYRGGGFLGIGYALTADDPFTALDLDHCRDPRSGRITPEAQEIIGTVNSYSELS